jgi:hypothetical protein
MTMLMVRSAIESYELRRLVVHDVSWWLVVVASCWGRDGILC